VCDSDAERRPRAELGDAVLDVLSADNRMVGQILGGAAQRVEDGATSLPILGDAIKAAQKRGIVSFDTAAINRSLKPLGQKLPDGLEGRAAIDHAQQALGDAYEGLLPKLKGDLNSGRPANAIGATGQAAKPTLIDELDSIRQLGANMPEQQAAQLNRIIDNEVMNRFTPAGKASGETLKNIESKLGGLAKDFSRSDNYDVRTLADGTYPLSKPMYLLTATKPSAAVQGFIDFVRSPAGRQILAQTGHWVK
jgi:hypothetical protein